MKPMTHKGYAAHIVYSDEDGCFVGHVAGVHDVLGFHGKTVSELKAAFKEAVDDYIETCKRLSRPPQKPYSGRILLRLPASVHARVAITAAAQGKSLNQWVAEALKKAAE